MDCPEVVCISSDDEVVSMQIPDPDDHCAWFIRIKKRKSSPSLKLDYTKPNQWLTNPQTTPTTPLLPTDLVNISRRKDIRAPLYQYTR